VDEHDRSPPGRVRELDLLGLVFPIVATLWVI
jgi:hypothetical protein